MVNNIRNNTISEISAKNSLNTLNEIKNAEIIKCKKCTPGHKLLNLFNNLFNIILTDETLESESQENEYEDYENEYEDYENDDDETIDQNEIIKSLNDDLDEIIDKSKSFENQIESPKKLEDSKEYLPYNDYDDKELKFKVFKLKLADMSNEIDEKLFEQIFHHTFIKLADRLMNNC